MTPGVPVPEVAPDEPGPAPAPDPPGWQRLDRRTILVEAVLPGLGTAGAVVAVGLLSGSGPVGGIFTLVALVALVVTVAVSAWVWGTTTFRVTATHVEVRSGLVVRSERSVARERLRSVDLTADLVHRAAGVTVVVIGTGRQGGDADDAVSLRSLSQAEGERLRAELLQRGPRVAADVAGAQAAPGVPETPLATFAASWVRLGPFSLLGLIAVGATVGAVGQLGEAIDWSAVIESVPVRRLLELVVGLQVLPTVLVVLAGLAVVNAVLSTVIYVVLYGGFRLVRAGDGTLRMTYGVLTRRSVTFEEARIRGVRLDEPLLLRLGGGARLKVIAAGLGGRNAQGEEKRDGDMLLPAVPVELARAVTATVLRTHPSPVPAPLTQPPARALRPLLLRWVPASALPSIGLAAPAAITGFPHWPWRLALLLVAVGITGALLERANLGHARVGEHLVIRGGAAVRRTAVVRCDGVIAWRFRRAIWHRRLRLLSASAAVAAGSGACTITYADQDAALGVARDAVPGWLDPFLEPDPQA